MRFRHETVAYGLGALARVVTVVVTVVLVPSIAIPAVLVGLYLEQEWRRYKGWRDRVKP